MSDRPFLHDYLRALGMASGARIVLFAPSDDRSSTFSWSDGRWIETAHARQWSGNEDSITERFAAPARRWLASGELRTGTDLSVLAVDDLPTAVAAVGPKGGEVGVLAVARDEPRPWTEGDLQTLRLFAEMTLYASAANPATREPRRGNLDDLFTQLATELMSVSVATMPKALQRTVSALTDFFEVDTGFLRRNDHVLGASILVAEWPLRENKPDPDPLGIVPFRGTDPVFAMIENLIEPYVVRPGESPSAYQERVQEGSGVSEVSLAMVPILHNDLTEGVLGFINFGDRAWAKDEVNALQAIASLIAQLQGRVDAEQRLQFQAYHDELTGLPNRLALIDDLRHRLRKRAGEPVPLLFFDLDRLKSLNDYFGHAVGDRMLSAVAERLRRTLGPDDLVGRLGGDEFVILLGHSLQTDDIISLGTRLLHDISQPLDIGGNSVARTGSIGIATGHPGRTSPDELMRDADIALLAAKADGGNTVRICSDRMRRALDNRADVEVHLRGAIERGELRVHYQPEYDLRTGKMLSTEALVRWQHPTRGLLSPADFIDIVEESNLIVELGNFVLEEACSRLASWRREFSESSELVVRVNVAPGQLISHEILNVVYRALEKNALPASRLCLEITEHGVMREIEKVADILQEFQDLGVTIAIDDFGTGSSSLATLKSLPIDALKIDQSFIVELGSNSEDLAIVESVVRLAETFHFDVVAEGVETFEAVDELLRLGCFRGQGYLLQRPVDPDEFRNLLLQQRSNLDTPWLVPRLA
jgi:diguanylate cyclase (GGDEF)-like protein